MPGTYRAEMGEPPMPDEGAPGPMTRRQRMGNLNIGSPSDVTPEERRKILRDMQMAMEPVSSGKEVGVRKAASKSEVYEKKFAKGGSASARADGCAQRGKTRGTMIAMCKGGYKK